ncbi:MAG: endolytic transglycosylase MltG [Candidatus Kapaibacterium sp.]|nr:MAG: endolytic transglycosylase MltG [Candidatus Kapabacteria bacterium]
MPLLKKLALLIAVPFVAGLGIVGYFAYQLNQKVELAAPIEFHIGPKTSLFGAIEQLENRSIVQYPLAARVFGRATAYFTGKSIQRGVYEIKPSMKLYEVIAQLFSARALQTVTVTFQEGIPLRKYADIASEKIGFPKQEFLRILFSDSLRKARKITSATVEGYLMPNTYEFYKHTPPAEVIDKLLDEQDEFWASLSASSSSSGTLPITRLQALTMASIVEAETPVDDEKPRVSGVYWNRFKIGMKLEADPTVQYALDMQYPKRESRRLLYRDLEIDSPYNTYKYTGLPIAPINSPGRAAIRAALAPEAHNFYYFVAKLDGTNTHTFTRNGAEHQQAVALFRARRRVAQQKG